MYAPINHEQLQKKWAPILDHEGTEPIKDQHKRMVTAQLLENQEQAIREEREFLREDLPTQNTGSSGATAGFSAGANAPVAGFDPVLISLIRRSMPNLVAYDLAGVQPMSGPTGLIFAMRSRFTSQSGAEALFNEPDTAFSAQHPDGGNDVSAGYTQNEGALTGGAVGFGTTGGTQQTNPAALNPEGSQQHNTYVTGRGMDTEDLSLIHI